ncbi:MAG: hypothetical protein JO353_07005, partial [Phycisphaerae bacterium]|nr:hypothetical protein [Phycisphaerae bacterium]
MMQTRLEQFVSHAQRRWMIQHSLECIACGMAAGCGIALCLIPLRILAGESGVMIGLGFPLLGGICGLIFSMHSYPTLGRVLDRA